MLSKLQNKKNKVSVITVVFNDAAHIRETIESVLSQTWEECEYLVIDGGSSDGTREIIREYEQKIAYWCSEPDKGIYDAMNKGILQATGDWICFLNSGDVFVDAEALANFLSAAPTTEADVIYGDSLEIDAGSANFLLAGEEPSKMEFYPIYRHGSSLVRQEVHRRFLFDLTQQSQFEYALDWHMIHQVYKAGGVFVKSNAVLEAFLKEGTSNHPLKNRWLNYKITSGNRFECFKFLLFLYYVLKHWVNKSGIYNYIRGFFLEYVLNSLLPHVPFWSWRKAYLKLVRANIGKGSFIMRKVYIQSPNRLKIGRFSHINRGCLVDARGNIKIGHSVSVSHNVSLVTGGHNYTDKYFSGKFEPITIEDFAWIGVGAIILQGVTIGKGAVVCAGSVVTKNVAAYDVVAGVPAKVIKKRPTDLRYVCKWETPFC